MGLVGRIQIGRNLFVPQPLALSPVSQQKRTPLAAQEAGRPAAEQGGGRSGRGQGLAESGGSFLKAAIPSFKSPSRRRPLPLPFPFPLPQLKPGWKAFAGWPQLLCPCPEGGASAVAPPGLAAWAPHPSPRAAAGAGGGHWSGPQARTCSATGAKGPVLRPFCGRAVVASSGRDRSGLGEKT